MDQPVTMRDPKAPGSKPSMFTKGHRPTVKQIKALQLVTQGYSKRAAMIKAGYSVTTAHNSQNLMKKEGVKRILSTLPKVFEAKGITTDFVAEKLKGAMEANKVHGSLTEPDYEVPDHQTRLKAIGLWKDFVKETEENQPGVKRKITLEEFIGT